MSTTSFSVRADSLKEKIRHVAFAASSEGLRYALHTIHWRIKKGQLALTATDGRRLCRAYVDAKYDGPQYETTICVTDCRKLAGMLTKTAGDVSVVLGNGSADFSWQQRFGKNKGSREFSCKANIGRFPDCDRIIIDGCDPQNSGQLHVQCNVEAPASVNSVIWDPKNGVFTRPRTVDGIRVVKSVDDPPRECFDLDYLLDFARAVGLPEEGTLQLMIPKKHEAIFVEWGGTDYVFMPMRED